MWIKVMGVSRRGKKCRVLVFGKEEMFGQLKNSWLFLYFSLKNKVMALKIMNSIENYDVAND